MKTYHIKWSGTVYETAEVQATDEDDFFYEDNISN